MPSVAKNDHHLAPSPDIYEVFVRRLGPVFIGEKLLAGGRLSGAVTRLSKLAADLQQNELSIFLGNVADWALKRCSERPAGADPTQGFGEKHPLWSLLLSGFGAPTPLDSVKLLFLRRMMQDRNFDAIAIAEEARTSIQQLDRFVPVAVTQHVDRLGAVAADVIKGSATGSEARALIVQLELKGILRSQPAKALKKLFFLTRQKPTPLEAHVRRRRRERRASHGTEQRTRFSAVELRPSAKSRGLEEFETRAITLAANPAGDESRTAIQQDGEALGRLLATQLDHSSHLYLSPDETRAAAIWLMKIAKDDLNTGRLLRAQACAIWLLSGVTARSPEQVIDDLILNNRSRNWKLVSPSLRCWMTEAPNAAHFWKPRNDHLKNAVAHNRVDKVTLALPCEVTELLMLLAHDQSSEPSIEWCDKSELLDECDWLKSSIRMDVCQRFGQTRWRLTVPIAAIEETSEPCIGQILGGQRYGLSDAPLHYYSTTVRSLRKTYAKAIYRQFGWKLNEERTGDETVGSSIATLDDAVFQSLIKELRSRILNEANTAPRVDRPWRMFNAIVDYTAWMIAAAVGHRMTHWVQLLTLLDIDPEGWGCLADKWTEGIGHLRIVALPPIAIRQINVLRTAATELLEQLRSMPGTAAARACQDIEARLLGRAPLLFRMVGWERVADFSVERLRQRTLQNTGLPGNIFRARLRMNLTRRGVQSQFVYWQLGHAYIGRDAFTEECLFSVPKFSSLLVGPLEDSLKADGWEAAPVATARRAALPWPEPQGPRRSPEVELLKLKTDFPSRFPHQNRPVAFEALALDAERAKTWATGVGETALAAARASHDLTSGSNESVTADDLIAWAVDQMVERSDSRHDVQSHLTALRAEVLRLKQEERIPLELPPMVTRLPSPPIGLTQVHVDAARWCSIMRRRWIEASKNANEEQTIGFLCLLAVTEGQATTVAHLHSLLNSICKNEFSEYPDDPDRVMIDVTTRTGKVRGTVLSLEASLIARRWRKGGLKTEVSLEEIHGYLQAAFTAETGDQYTATTLERLFAVACFGLRVVLPGAICSTLCTEDVRTLTVSRTLEFLGHRVAQPRVPLELPEDTVNSVQKQGIDEALTPTGTLLSIQQLRSLSRKLSALRERGDKQRLVRNRWKKACAQIEIVASDKDTTATMLCLARFAGWLFAPDRDTAIAAAYGRFVSVAKRLVLTIGSEKLARLSAAELEEIYLNVLEIDSVVMVPERRAVIASNLLAFHEANKGWLADADLSAVLAYARERPNIDPRVEIVTEFEFEALEKLQISLVEDGLISAAHSAQMHLMQGELHAFGLRIGEVIHQRIRDIENRDSNAAENDSNAKEQPCRVQIRASAIGTVKSFAARRTFEVGTDWNQPLRNRLLDERRRASSTSANHNQPLIQFAHPASIDGTLNLLRRALVCVSGGQAVTLHSFRHVVASRLILDHIHKAASLKHGECPPSAWSYTRWLGQSRPCIALMSYWHLAHLAHVRCWPDPLSTADRAAFEGVSTSALRHRRRRPSTGQNQ